MAYPPHDCRDLRPNRAGTMWARVPRLASVGRSRSPAQECPLQAAERCPQRVEPDRAEVEGGGVELLEVELGALVRFHLVPGLQPDPLPDLVRRRLTRPAEVAVDLEPQLA